MKNEINFFNSEKILRLTAIKADTLEVADKIINGYWKIFPTLPEIEVKEPSDVWEMSFSSAQSTYSLYTYALYPVSYLLNAYEVSKNTFYLINALDLTQNFLLWLNSSDKTLSDKRIKILWGDHAVSNRTQVLCYLVSCLISEGESIPENLKNELISNGKYLSDVQNYSSYNHGLMMDLALIGLINVLKGSTIEFPKYFQLNLVSRLHDSLTRDMTDDGVHIENSIGYHFWIMKFFERIIQPLSLIDEELSRVCQDSYNKSLNYASYVTRSDGSIPPIGDTHALLKAKPTFALGSRFFSRSNIVIFRDLEDRVWASFSSGYKTHIHKHGDDGSFNLFYKGHDIFFDPGFLNYEDEEDSLAIKSSSFHNTIKPENEEMLIVKQEIEGNKVNEFYKENLSDSKIIGFYADSNYESSLAIVSGYTCGDIRRLIIFSRQGFFIIHDSVIEPSSENNIFTQRFNIGNNLEIEHIESNGFVVKDNQDKNLCEIKQFTRAASSSSFKPPFIEETFFAKKFNVKDKCQRLIFTFKGPESLIFIKLCDYNPNEPKKGDDSLSNFISAEYLYNIVDLNNRKFC